MLGLSLFSFLTLTGVAAATAVVYHYGFRYRFLGGGDAFFGKLMGGWFGAWLASPVLGTGSGRSKTCTWSRHLRRCRDHPHEHLNVEGTRESVGRGSVCGGRKGRKERRISVRPDPQRPKDPGAR